MRAMQAENKTFTLSINLIKKKQQTNTNSHLNTHVQNPENAHMRARTHTQNTTIKMKKN